MFAQLWVKEHKIMIEYPALSLYPAEVDVGNSNFASLRLADNGLCDGYSQTVV